LKLLISIAVLLSLNWGEGQVVGKLENPALRESSGIVASRRNPGLYWTHNDSGNPAEIFLIDRTGKDYGTWRVPAATNIDWEDIAVGPGPDKSRTYLYLGDIGDNAQRRRDIAVYRIPEPAAESRGGATEPAAVFRYRYPDHAHDAEALLVHPETGAIYVVVKAKGQDVDTVVFKAPAQRSGAAPVTLERIAKLDLPPEFDLTALTGRITGGDISPDGTRMVLCDYVRAYEFVLPEGQPFDTVWQQNLEVINPGPRLQGEGVAYRLDGQALLFTSEGLHSPVVEVLRKK